MTMVTKSIEAKAEAVHSDSSHHTEYGPPRYANDADNLTSLGYEQQLQRNRSTFTLLFQSLAVAAVRYPCHPLCRFNRLHSTLDLTQSLRSRTDLDRR